MEILQTVIGIIGMICLFGLPVIAVAGLIGIKRHKEDPGYQKKVIGAVAVCALLAFGCYLAYFMMSVHKYSARENAVGELPTFTVSSENLHDGVWDDIISNTDAGENRSPQLSWEPVEGAGAYGILMVDPDGQNWIHWKTASVTQTDLPTGYASADTYVGPYPPAGTEHTYVIYVAALREPDSSVLGTLDQSCVDLDMTVDGILASMDVTEGGKTGNMIALGTISGTYHTNSRSIY